MSAVVEMVTEEVASNLEEAAVATRKINASGAGYLFGGLLIGLATGFYVGNRWKRATIKAEALAHAEDEISSMREYYKSKTTAAQAKPPIEDVVEDLGYSAPPIPESVKVAPTTKDRKRPTTRRVTKPPVPVTDPDLVIVGNWDYAVELASRTPDEPYIIHKEEFRENDKNYSQVTYTYYEGDDVMVDESERPLPHADLVVGQTNLKWGHGSDDPNLVYIRNEKLESDMEICRSPGSYEEEVLGLDSNDPS